MGNFRVATGRNIIGIEGDVAWVTPESWTEHNYPCGEGGEGCQVGQYLDPGYIYA